MQYHIRTGESTSEAVIRAVADATDQDPLELQPIAESIDPDAVNVMFTRAAEEDVEALTLLYEGCRVEVDCDTVYIETVD